MADFSYAIKTDKSIENGENYFTVIAWGTKRQMMEWAKTFDAMPDTVESKITRSKDKAIVHSYRR